MHLGLPVKCFVWLSPKKICSTDFGSTSEYKFIFRVDIHEQKDRHNKANNHTSPTLHSEHKRN